MLEYANRFDAGESPHDIQNIWSKDADGVYENPMRDLIADLDELPFPDRDIYYDRYPSLQERPTKVFMYGRGCPYKCTYCFNHMYQTLCADKGTYIRMRSVDNVITEMKQVREQYGFSWVQLNDDTFNMNKQWSFDFLEAYKKEIGVEFLVNMRPELIDEDVIRHAKACGLDRISVGIEHGNETIRREILNRQISNEQLIKKMRMINTYDIRIQTLNIMGLPGETLENAFETVAINQQFTSWDAACFVFQPYPGTDIFNYCVSHGYIDKDFDVDSVSYQRMGGSVLKQKDIQKLANLQRFFHLVVQYPWLKPIVLLLINLPPNRFFDLVWDMPNIAKTIKYAGSWQAKLQEIKNLFLTFIGVHQ